MSDYQQFPHQPQYHQYQPPATPKKKRRWLVPTVVGAVAVTIGFGIGSTDTSTAEPKTITKTETKTETVTDKVTPQSCLDALDAAEQIRKDAVKFGDSMVEISTVHQQWPRLVLKAARAGATYDMAAIEEITATVESITSDVQDVNADLDELADETGQDVATYQLAAEECRSAS